MSLLSEKKHFKNHCQSLGLYRCTGWLIFIAMLLLFPFVPKYYFSHISVLIILYSFISLFKHSGLIKPSFVSWRLLLLPTYCVVLLIGNLYADNMLAGFKVLERLIMAFLMPLIILVFFHMKLLKRSSLTVILTVSIILIAVLELVELFSGILLPVWNKAPSFLSFMVIVRNMWPIYQHPSYLSYLILIYIMLVLDQAFHGIKLRMPIWIVTVFSIFFVVLLGARSATGAMVLLIIYYIGKTIGYLKYKYRFIVGCCTILLFAFLFFNTRLGVTVNKVIKVDDISQIDVRATIWSNAWDLIKEKPLFGYGVGDAQSVLAEHYVENGFEKGILLNFNAHNQFLDNWLQAGVFGVIALLALFIIPFIQALKKKQELLALFLGVSFIFLLFESMLTRLAGIIYFAFFYSYLYYVYYQDEPESIT